MKITSLQDLKKVQKSIAEAAARQEAERVAQLEAQRRLAAQKNLFQQAAGAVHRLPDKRQALLKKQPPAPIATQMQLDEQDVMVEAISDGLMPAACWKPTTR